MSRQADHAQHHPCRRHLHDKYHRRNICHHHHRHTTLIIQHCNSCQMLETTAPIAVFRTGQGIVPHPKVGGGVCGAVRGGVGGMGGLATGRGVPWRGGRGQPGTREPIWSSAARPPLPPPPHGIPPPPCGSLWCGFPPAPPHCGCGRLRPLPWLLLVGRLASGC